MSGRIHRISRIDYNQLMLAYLKKRVPGFWRFLRQVFRSYSEHDGSHHAAALAYFALFSIFPLLLFIIYIASLFFPSIESRAALSIYLEEIFPYGAENLSLLIEQTWQARGSIGLISGIALLWGGSSVFGALEASLSAVWGTTPRTFLRRRFLAMVSVLVLVIAFIVSFIISPVTSWILDSLLITAETATYIWELVMLVVTLILLYRIFPNETVPWGAAFMGAFFAAVLIMVARLGFKLYVSLSIVRNGFLYGSLAWFLALALWVYLISVLMLWGAEFAAAFQLRQIRLKRLSDSGGFKEQGLGE